MIKIKLSLTEVIAFVVVFLLGIWAVNQSGLLNALAIIAGQTVMWCVIYVVKGMCDVGNINVSSFVSSQGPRRSQAPKGPAPLTE